MAKGENAAKRWGKEYWSSRLHKYGESLGAYTKHLTHKKERRKKKEIERKAIEDHEDF